MSYQGITDLSRDSRFRDRLGGVLAEQGKSRYDPAASTPDSWLAAAVLRAPDYWIANWSYMIASEPGFATDYETNGLDAISDGMLLAAVQANWSRIASLFEAQINPSTGV